MMKAMNELKATDRVIFHCGKGGSKEIIDTRYDKSTGEVTAMLEDGSYFALPATDMVFISN